MAEQTVVLPTNEPIYRDRTGDKLDPKKIQTLVNYKGTVMPAGEVRRDANGRAIWHPYSTRELNELASNLDLFNKDENVMAQQNSQGRSKVTTQGTPEKPPAAPPPGQTTQPAQPPRNAPQPQSKGLTNTGGYQGAQAAAPTDPWADLAQSSSLPANTKINVGPAGPQPVLNIPGGDYTPVQQHTIEDELKSLTTMSGDKLKALQQRLSDAGFKVEVNGVPDSDTIAAYRGLLQNAALIQQAGSPLTPDDLLGSMAKANPANQTKTIHESSTKVDVTDPITARKTIESAMADKLGRKPTDWEIAQFTSALNTYEQQNPTTSNTTITQDGAGNEKNSQTTQTGKTVDPGSFASQYVQDNHGPEAQAINHLSWYNVAMQALTSPSINTGLST